MQSAIREQSLKPVEKIIPCSSPRIWHFISVCGSTTNSEKTYWSIPSRRNHHRSRENRRTSFCHPDKVHPNTETGLRDNYLKVNIEWWKNRRVFNNLQTGNGYWLASTYSQDSALQKKGWECLLYYWKIKAPQTPEVLTVLLFQWHGKF